LDRPATPPRLRRSRHNGADWPNVRNRGRAGRNHPGGGQQLAIDVARLCLETEGLDPADCVWWQANREQDSPRP
jgi:hypothetical protein